MVDAKDVIVTTPRIRALADHELMGGDSLSLECEPRDVGDGLSKVRVLLDMTKAQRLKSVRIHEVGHSMTRVLVRAFDGAVLRPLDRDARTFELAPSLRRVVRLDVPQRVEDAAWFPHPVRNILNEFAVEDNVFIRVNEDGPRAIDSLQVHRTAAVEFLLIPYMDIVIPLPAFLPVLDAGKLLFLGPDRLEQAWVNVEVGLVVPGLDIDETPPASDDWLQILRALGVTEYDERSQRERVVVIGDPFNEPLRIVHPDQTGGGRLVAVEFQGRRRPDG